ncbi:MAG TPA: hypothetical protein VMQ76_13425 [Terracidiphilus sp.]|jgi:hypothetical protein|nr:hypothetical protein [Terracidiphilus sp.]
MAQLAQTPVWYQERGKRRQYRQNAKCWGIRVPKLPTICLVEPQMIDIPAWAAKKAVRGVQAPPGGIWLRRIAATKLAGLDRAEGGRPKITITCYRLCNMCGRGLIGTDAEIRWEQDRRFEASKTCELRYDRDEGHRGTYANGGNPEPCGPDCIERIAAVRRPRGRPKNI